MARKPDGLFFVLFFYILVIAKVDLFFLLIGFYFKKVIQAQSNSVLQRQLCEWFTFVRGRVSRLICSNYAGAVLENVISLSSRNKSKNMHTIKTRMIFLSDPRPLETRGEKFDYSECIPFVYRFSDLRNPSRAARQIKVSLLCVCSGGELMAPNAGAQNSHATKTSLFQSLHR